jgi:hypothetical protein
MPHLLMLLLLKGLSRWKGLTGAHTPPSLPIAQHCFGCMKSWWAAAAGCVCVCLREREKGSESLLKVVTDAVYFTRAIALALELTFS